MVIRNGWLRVRNWLIPWGDAIMSRQTTRYTGGARAATPQPFVSVQPTDWFAELEAEKPRGEHATNSVTTKPYLLGRYGFDQFEQSLLLEQAGSEERLLRLIDWVEKAHRRLKMFVLLERKQEEAVQAIQEAHPLAVTQLSEILGDSKGEDNEEIWRAKRHRQTAEEIWGDLQRKLPGLVFPKARSKDELEEWIAAALNINSWLAQHGTFACKCRALPDPIHV